MFSHATGLIYFIIVLNCASVAFGQGSSQTQMPKMPKWKMALDSYYYDFQGRHPADGNIYGFEGVHFSTQMLTASYSLDPLTQLSLVMRHSENYAETRFSGVLYHDTTRGLNDTLIKGTKTFIQPSGLYIVDIALSLPTGSVSEKNKNAPDFNYPYNMQLGSGTYDLQNTLMYLKPMGKNQIGLLGMATIRTGRNQYDYRRGNEYIAKAWYSYTLNKYLTPGVWVNYHHFQRFSGADSTFGRNLYVEFYHTPRHFWDMTFNMTSQYQINSSLTLKAMLGLPIWQKSKNIDNVQVYTQWFTQLGIQSTF